MAKLAKLDDDGNVITESVVETATIKVDGQDVEVPQSVATILEKADHDLHSRNERVLREERDRTANLLAEDTEWLNNHPTELWVNYQPKVSGGKGFIGDPTMLEKKPDQKKPDVTVTAENPEVMALKEEVKQTKEALAAIMTDLGKTGEMKVIETRDSLSARYPNADPDSVNDGLRVFFQNNGRHPSVTEIETIMKSRHDFTTAKITAAKTPSPTSTVVIPPVGGGPPPSISKTKTPRLDDIEGWKGLAHADNVQSG